ncbi:MAG: DoxX family protein [Ignavibacteria bacterium GWA2_35_9]|nr:MAG: DoxX family protein [Ignavibacteria bacterium GWA2_35_9]OGU46794.1 MAG: DoxX family protein [Ignavibacteria bacterium GWB2_36_8]OGU48059.1 MAG: DoxX family protein [Ignavibacteria bacterium GWC2_36_12]
MEKIFSTTNNYTPLFIRLIVGAIFLSEGIQKFLFPDVLGVGRFIKIGIPAPETMAPFVGVVEIVFGTLVLIGFFTRLASIPLLINISVAILSTKIPILLGYGYWYFNLPKLQQYGFWSMMHEARTDFSMFLGALFLIIVGSGKLSFDYIIYKNKINPEGASKNERIDNKT